MAVKMKDNVYWVGVVDWALRHFHGYELTTHRGSTYNAYLIKDEKTVLVDTAWGPFAKEFIENVRSVVDPSTIDIVVTNHAEPDHSGSLPEIMKLVPNAEVVVSKRGLQSVPGHYHQNWRFRAVGTGDRINIGSSDLIFVEAPMLHWPDSMFTYLTGKNILMPNDAFGHHYATAGRFNDEVDREELYEEALKYYANILTPFSDKVLAKIDEVLALKLPVDMIAPSHGIIWRKDPLQIVTKYQEWAAQKPEMKAVILYDTMWEATRHMAEAVGEGLAEAGLPFKILCMAVSDRNDAITDVFRSRAVVVGSPTINNGILPTMMPVLTDIKGLKFKHKIGAAFGSFGWSGESVKHMEEILTQSGIQIAREGLKVKWQPGVEDLAACRKLGREVGEAAKKPV